jgi:hypothetical protein
MLGYKRWRWLGGHCALTDRSSTSALFYPCCPSTQAVCHSYSVKHPQGQSFIAPATPSLSGSSVNKERLNCSWSMLKWPQWRQQGWWFYQQGQTWESVRDSSLDKTGWGQRAYIRSWWLLFSDASLQPCAAMKAAFWLSSTPWGQAGDRYIHYRCPALGSADTPKVRWSE